MSMPLYRRELHAASLLRNHPPRFRHPHKAALFEIAYPEGSEPAGTIEVTRWAAHVPERVSLPPTLDAQVRPEFYDYAPSAVAVASAPAALEWHVNFANPRLFVAYGSGLLAQDEMQLVEHPLLGCVREALLAEGLAAATVDREGATPILVRNVERRIEIATNPDPSAGRPFGLYGNRFMAAPIDVVRRATRRVDPPTYSNVIAMAAPAGGRGEYTDREIEYVFQTAFTAFAAARSETPLGSPLIVHTGFWGCGAFGGNRTLMVAVQALAARAAYVNRLVFHAGDPVGAKDATLGLDVAERLALRCGVACTLATITGRTALLGYRWGESDGN